MGMRAGSGSLKGKFFVPAGPQTKRPDIRIPVYCSLNNQAKRPLPAVLALPKYLTKIGGDARITIFCVTADHWLHWRCIQKKGIQGDEERQGVCNPMGVPGPTGFRARV